MTPIELNKLLYTAVILLVIQLFSHLLKRFAKQTQRRFSIRQSRYFAIKRLLTLSSLFVSGLVLLLIWDVNIKHVWVSLTGLLALIAVAFFAVWSLVGNILAGVILYFTAPFKSDDTIMVLPDEVGGTVLAINTFYTVLIDEDKNYINIPNSLFFQKYVKVVKHHVPRAVGETASTAAPPGMTQSDDGMHWPSTH
ncbi:MAG: mechanosensitive ion channel family protein [Kiritimatiellia bacterium]